jgi:hypothetical protein
MGGMTATPLPSSFLVFRFTLNLTLNFNPLDFGAVGRGGTKIKIRARMRTEEKERDEAMLAAEFFQAQE